MTECLFIGGSSDGHWINVDLSMDYISTISSEPKFDMPINASNVDDCYVFTTEVYKKHELREKGRSIFVYVYTELDYCSLIAYILLGYRQPNKENGG